MIIELVGPGPVLHVHVHVHLSVLTSFIGSCFCSSFGVGGPGFIGTFDEMKFLL